MGISRLMNHVHDELCCAIQDFISSERRATHISLRIFFVFSFLRLLYLSLFFWQKLYKLFWKSLKQEGECSLGKTLHHNIYSWSSWMMNESSWLFILNDIDTVKSFWQKYLRQIKKSSVIEDIITMLFLLVYFLVNRARKAVCNQNQNRHKSQQRPGRALEKSTHIKSK